MRVLIVNSVDIRSGAARAAYRLHQGLLEKNVDSLMLVNFKHSDDYTVLSASTKKTEFLRKINAYRNRITKRKYNIKNQVSFSLANGPDDIVKRIAKLDPDVVHFHWFNKGFVNLASLETINKPVVWTLHDMWAFTGGCHYNQWCEKFKQSCGACPVLGSSDEKDLSSKIYRRKHKIYPRIKNFHIVTPSNWMGNCAKSSSLLKNIDINVIPNCIDINTYKPLDKHIARKALNLPLDKTLIAFGALKVTSDPRKGYTYIKDALKIIDKRQVSLAVFGSSKPADHSSEIPTYFLGKIFDDATLALVYSAVDVMVVPSLQENLGNTIMEALSCGTPVVAFGIGGNGDMIDHKSNGYLAESKNVADLANGIDWVIKNNIENQLSINARDKVAACFNSQIITEKHLKLYKKIV